MSSSFGLFNSFNIINTDFANNNYNNTATFIKKKFT